MLQAAIAAAKNRYVRTFDVGQAFLNSELQKEIHVILDKEVVDIMVTIDKVYEQFRRKDGSMIVQLMKALYGIVEAPKLWYDTLSAYLISQGFKRSELDNCYFVKTLQFEKQMDDNMDTKMKMRQMYGCLHFAGEATHEGSCATTQSAVLSGQRAANEVIRVLQHSNELKT